MPKNRLGPVSNRVRNTYTEKKRTAFHFELKPHIMLIITHFWHNRINFKPSTRFIFSAWRPKRTELQDRFSKQTTSHTNQSIFFSLFIVVVVVMFWIYLYFFSCVALCTKNTQRRKKTPSTWNSTSVLMMPCVSDVMHIRYTAWRVYSLSFFFVCFFFFVSFSIPDFHSISIDVNCKLVTVIIIHGF